MSQTLRQEFDAAIENMTTDDMPSEDFKSIAEFCGLNVAVSLMKNMPGLNIYVPKPQNAFTCVVKRFVIDKFDGSNAKTLAMVCRVSQRHVYSIVETEDKKRKSKPKNKVPN